MDIKSIGNTGGVNPLHEQYNKHNAKQDNEQAKVKGDKIEISSQARDLQAKNVSTKDFAMIKERINTNYYDSPEVIGKVAEEILKELNAE